MLDRKPEHFIALKNLTGAYVGTELTIKDANFPVPFYTGLEYPPPARGGWNIVHIGLTLPQSHLIFVCPEGCLRGVVLSAAELDLADRFSTIAVGETNVLEGTLETQVIEGVSHIIAELPEKPAAVLVYTSCIHQFLGCDMDLIYSTLRQRFTDIDFTDCYMFPIMRKSGPNPIEMMRRQLFSLLKPRRKKHRTINIIGSDLPLAPTSDIAVLLAQNGWTVHELSRCQDYVAYQRMAESVANVVLLPSALKAGEALAQRLDQPMIYLPMSYDDQEIDGHLQALCKALDLPYHHDVARQERGQKALAQALAIIGQTPICIDYTATPRPLSLARRLLAAGFNVTDVYTDVFQVEEQADFKALQTSAPLLKIHPTTDVGMRVIDRTRREKVLAIGQKAAYYTSSPYFVNIIEGNGSYGYEAVYQMAQAMVSAFMAPKDTAALIPIKALDWQCGWCQR